MKSSTAVGALAGLLIYLTVMAIGTTIGLLLKAGVWCAGALSAPRGHSGCGAIAADLKGVFELEDECS
jgi:hypothetical protein